MALTSNTNLLLPPHQSSDPLSDSNVARELQRDLAIEEAIEIAVTVSFQCPSCRECGPVDDSIELDCGHRLCRDCFVNYLRLKIEEKQVDQCQLRCPLACNTEITVMQVYGALKDVAPELWDRFQHTRFEHWQPAEGDVRGDCPRCSTPFTIPSRRLSLTRSWSGPGEEASCPTCKFRFCPECSKSHPGLTCDEYREKELLNNPEEREFEQYLTEVGGKRCPVCSSPCIRESGCNYMTCPSQRCRGRTRFCYICGVQLRSSFQHVVHFPQGPYQDVCFGAESEIAEQGTVQGFFQDRFRQWDTFFQNGV